MGMYIFILLVFIIDPIFDKRLNKMNSISNNELEFRIVFLKSSVVLILVPMIMKFGELFYLNSYLLKYILMINLIIIVRDIYLFYRQKKIEILYILFFRFLEIIFICSNLVGVSFTFQ